MARAKIVWKPNALYEVRSMPGARAEVNGLAARMAAAAGDGFEWSARQGRKAPQGRWRAIVFPATYQARRRNASDNVLVRVMGSVR